MPDVENETFKMNPFAALDPVGGSQPMKIAMKRPQQPSGRKLGICGGHGGDPIA